MISNAIEMYGFALPEGDFEIVVGEASLSQFNEFMGVHYQWAWSGINWQKSSYEERVKLEDRREVPRVLKGLIAKYGLSGGFCLWFDNGNAIQLIKGDVAVLCEMVGFFDKHPDWFCNDYWIYSEDTGQCLEIYHEDVITLGASGNTVVSA